MHMLWFFIVLCLRITVSEKCDSFNNVEVTVRGTETKPHPVTITGCIERTAFEEDVVEINIENKNIPKLGPDSVRNMKNLQMIVFDNCVETAEPEAFRNVPNLSTLKIIQGRLKSIRKGVFFNLPKVQILKLYRNKVTQIEDQAFSNMESLEKFYFAGNNMKEWKKNWFENSTKLALMDFSRNKVKIIPRRAFDGFPSIRHISFDYNEVEVIESEAFKGLTHLDFLGLKYNRLKSIDWMIFPDEIYIKTFYLNANYLNFIPKRIMVNLKVKHLTMGGNPWKCPCYDQILFWISDTNGTVNNLDQCTGQKIPVCSFPKSFSRTCREVVEDDVTKTFLDQLRQIDPPLDKTCARLD